MRVSYLILTHNRKNDLRVCLESILRQDYPDIEIVVVDNNSTDGTQQMLQDNPAVTYFRLDYNSGVCKGRNIGFEKATGEIIIIIDDDGELPDADLTTRVVENFAANPELGVIALKVINPREPAARRVVPSTDKSIANKPSETEVAYFLGGGIAIRRQVLAEVGYYPEEYFYAMEELDLSYRIAKTRWKIYYYPQLRILHHESPVQRPSWRRFYYDFRNRIWLATSYLPMRYLVVNLSIWGLLTFVQALRFGHCSHFFRGVAHGFRDLEFFRQRRRDMLLQPSEIKRIKMLKGRLLY